MGVEVVEIATGVFHARSRHTAWVLITDGDAVTLIDAGYPGDRARVLASLEHIRRAPGDLDAILLTHAHADHLGCVEHLRSSQGVPVHAHELELPNVTGEKIEQVGLGDLLPVLWRPATLRWLGHVVRQGGTRPERPRQVTPFTDGPLDVPGRPVAVHTPGHTSGHTCFHLPDRGVLIAGDALMTEHALSTGEGPRLLPDFFNTDSSLARASLHRLQGLAGHVVVPAHGPAFRGSPNRAACLALASD